MINSLATGGAEHMVVQLAKHGVRAGHEVRIVLLEDKDGIPRTLAEDAGLQVTALGRSVRDPRLLIRLRTAVQGADIVHAHLFPAMYWVAMVPGVKVFTEHSTHNRRIGKRLFRLPERWAYDRYERIIAIGPGVERRVREHAETIRSRTSVVVANNGVADEFYRQEKRSSCSATAIVSVGSLTAVKQHHLAIQALALLPDATLNIAGEGPLRVSLERLIAELGLGTRVHLLGSVEDVPRLLAAHDLLLSTSKYEGFSLAAAEAQAVGLPVIGPDVEGFDSVVVHQMSGLLFEAQDARTIADLVRQVSETETYRRLSQGAVVNARRFSMKASLSANLGVYRSVLNDVRRSG
ncbi:glycosyltransferase [Microbacterium esteraromaticum]|uniref:glycosyltransferase n=1 Tax=Microbacterium esteraromaticum TaxID=57043 RepID=UPI0030A83461